jgi:hypothetical protein
VRFLRLTITIPHCAAQSHFALLTMNSKGLAAGLFFSWKCQNGCSYRGGDGGGLLVNGEERSRTRRTVSSSITGRGSDASVSWIGAAGEFLGIPPLRQKKRRKDGARIFRGEFTARRTTTRANADPWTSLRNTNSTVKVRGIPPNRQRQRRSPHGRRPVRGDPERRRLDGAPVVRG